VEWKGQLGDARRPPFGSLLRQFRLAAGLSQEFLAERARVSVDTIGALERGARKAPHRETLTLLSDGLGLTRPQHVEFEAAAAASRTVGRPRLGATPNNLPIPRSSFHGRDRELAELGKLVQARHLITLRGAGGAGKSRLAVEVAREQLGRGVFSDGIWLVELLCVNDPLLVPATIARTLSLGSDDQRSALDVLVAALRNRCALIILDNCDHLLGACAPIARRLGEACPLITILATSREALELDGELQYQVTPLGLPVVSREPTGMRETLDELRCSPAAQVFMDRAEDADPHTFNAAAARDPASVAQICIRLDGLPLALELAAARARDLSLKEIVAGLDARFTLLTHGKRTAFPHHQTLRALLDWSYDDLSPLEKRVFRGLGSFAGSWTAESAAAVSGLDEAADDFRESFAALISKSLVVVIREEDVVARYTLLESIRTYARMLLAENGETDKIATRHAQLLRDRALRAEALWLAGFAPTANDAFQSLFNELDEMRAALDWSIGERKDLELGAELTSILADVWGECGLHAEGLQRMEAAETALSRDAAPQLVVPLRFATARMLSRLQLSGAVSAAEDAAKPVDSPSAVGDRMGWRHVFDKRRDYRAGDVIFRRFDDAEELFYITSGVVSLEEIGVRIGRGELLGEIAFFSPTKQRTASASCLTDVTVMCIDQSNMLRLYQEDSSFRFYLIQLFARRLIQDLQRTRPQTEREKPIR